MFMFISWIEKQSVKNNIYGAYHIHKIFATGKYRILRMKKISTNSFAPKSNGQNQLLYIKYKFAKKKESEQIIFLPRKPFIQKISKKKRPPPQNKKKKRRYIFTTTCKVFHIHVTLSCRYRHCLCHYPGIYHSGTNYHHRSPYNLLRRLAQHRLVDGC